MPRIALKGNPSLNVSIKAQVEWPIFVIILVIVNGLPMFNFGCLLCDLGQLISLEYLFLFSNRKE